VNLLTHTLDSLWQVVLVGLVLGAGLPSLFALGVRALDTGSGGGTASPAAKAAAVLCFAVVACAVLAGILLLAGDFLSGTFGIDIF